MRKLYAERRDATAAGLESVLKQHVRIDAQPGGMHLILRLQGKQSDRRLVARMREAGLYAEALTDWTTEGEGASALLVNFTNVDSQGTAEKLGKRMLKLMTAAAARPGSSWPSTDGASWTFRGEP